MDDQNSQQFNAEFHRSLESIFAQGSGTAARILAFAKLRIEANERLIILASTMLTLTASAAVGITAHSSLHLTSDKLRLLLGAWRLLIMTIICCIVSNSRHQRAASSYDNELLAAELKARHRVLSLLAKQSNSTIEIPPFSAVITESGRMQEQIANWLGWAARISMVLAFILLYKFAKNTIAY